jgi:hypothetical protein
LDAFDHKLESIKQLLGSQTRQNWLFGAGISCDSKIPLMYPLTKRVEKIINDGEKETEKVVLSLIKADLPDDCHVEHYLSHLGDLLAISERSKTKTACIGGKTYPTDQLKSLYKEIITAIGEIIRYGYVHPDPKKGIKEEVGTSERPIVEITRHYEFIEALLLNQTDLERRFNINFFTTNYDTLLEDSLALHKKIVCDGFLGGSVAFWSGDTALSEPSSDTNVYHLYKLHGSIDWHKDDRWGLVRARYGTTYLSSPDSIMIYPQATKYVETQKDPFASLFLGLRKALTIRQQNTLITCGYSFGDEHINSEIESALRNDRSQTTVIAFVKEVPKNDVVINKTLDSWLRCPKIGARVYVAGELGIYHASTTPLAESAGCEYRWWRFDGLTQFIKTGEPQ